MVGGVQVCCSRCGRSDYKECVTVCQGWSPGDVNGAGEGSRKKGVYRSAEWGS